MTPWSSDFAQLLGSIHHNGYSAILATTAVLITVNVMQLLRLEWFSRKPADVRRDIIALREVEQQKGKHGKTATKQ